MASPVRLGALRVPRRGRVLGRIAFYSLAVFAGLPLAFSQVLLSPHRQPAGPPPPGYEERRLTSEGLSLRAWVREGRPSRPAAVIVHGVGDSLESYVAVADVLARRGHTVLLLDLRGHGGSDGSYMTLGGHEREDVRAALDHLSRNGLAPSGTILMGWSMGAVAVLRAAAGRSDVRAVIVEAPYDSYRETVARHAWLIYHIPRWVPLIPLSIAAAEWRGGFDADEIDAVDAARRVSAPLLAIADGEDPRMPEAVVRRVHDAHGGSKRFWLAQGVDHVGAILHPEYWRTVVGFLEERGL